MSGLGPVEDAAGVDALGRKPLVDCTSDSSDCLTETFTDREVVLTRCLEQRNCRHKQFYLNMAICSCPARDD